MKALISSIFKGVSNFFGGLSLKSILIGLAVLTVVSAVYFMNNWIQGVVAENTRLTTENTQLTTTLQQSQAATAQALGAIDGWKAAFQTYVDEVAKDAERRQAAEDKVRSLNAKFSRHDLSALGHARPALVQERLNAGSDDAARSLRCATGSTQDSDRCH